MVMIGFIGGLASQMNNYAFLLAMRKRCPDLVIKAVNGCFEHNGYELDRVFGINLDWADLSVAQRLSNFHISRQSLVRKAFNAGHRLRCMLQGPRLSHLNMVEYSSPESVFPTDMRSRDYVIWGNCTRVTLQETKNLFFECMKFRRPLVGRNEEMANRMRAGNSVSIHLRRGDYLKGGYRLLDSEYYRAAIKQIESKVRNPHYCIFSDDAECARTLFCDLPSKTFVDWNKRTDSCFDLQLMSLCKHNIIANSGFSCMAAWLNANPGRLVVAPRCQNASDAAVTEKWGWIQI